MEPTVSPLGPWRGRDPVSPRGHPGTSENTGHTVIQSHTQTCMGTSGASGPSGGVKRLAMKPRWAAREEDGWGLSVPLRSWWPLAFQL